MTDAISIQVGRRLKALRVSRGLTQAQLSQLSLRTIKSISNIERGQATPGLVTLEKFASILGCQISDFFVDVKTAEQSCELSNAAQKVQNALAWLSEDDIQMLAAMTDEFSKRAKR